MCVHGGKDVSLKHRRVLVLNKSWYPVGTVSFERAIGLIFSCYINGDPKARIIHHETYQVFNWDDWCKIPITGESSRIHTSSIDFQAPEIILLTRYNKVPQPRMSFCRKTIVRRDKRTCQYCEKKLNAEDCTIDHILPRSRGGQSTWKNCVIACTKCNVRKGSRTPREARMVLAKNPQVPPTDFFRFNCVCKKSWESFIGKISREAG